MRQPKSLMFLGILMPKNIKRLSQIPSEFAKMTSDEVIFAGAVRLTRQPHKSSPY
jgi:hypothetical protein